jgi:DNA (cytosine-5)-methyltransferase 1
VTRRLLDLYCGAGVGAKGYRDAGWYVIGVDKEPQPHYAGDEFFQFDALEYLLALIETGWAHDSLAIDGIHASPPCQFATDYRRRPNHVGEHENLIPETRELLEQTQMPWVIENVEKAAPWLRDPVMFCGSMFDLDVQRHRLFETNWPLRQHHWPCRHEIWTARYPAATNRAENSRRTVEVGVWRIPLETQKEAMGVDWEITREELSLGIPPAYTKWVGQQLLDFVTPVAA